jgi:hypothetical protein
VAHILTRKYGSGSTRYTAVIRSRQGKCVVHREAKTFTHRAAALTWAKHREVALENPGTRAQAQHGTPTLAELIRWYIDTFESISKWQRSKQTHLGVPRASFHWQQRCADPVAVPTLIDHVRPRRAAGAGPATVANDLTWIGVVLRAAKSVKGLPVRPGVAQGLGSPVGSCASPPNQIDETGARQRRNLRSS